MNKQQLISAVQSELSVNRQVISDMHQELKIGKSSKKFYDEIGNLEQEYAWHNNNKHLKQALAKMVKSQKALKYILQELYAAEEF